MTKLMERANTTKKIRNKIIWLRISYWVGAILDGLWIIPMLYPTLGGTLYGIKDFNPGPDYRFAMAIAAAMMAGWTVLLIWADRKPLERRGVLLLTIIPVKVCLDLSNYYLIAYDVVTVTGMIPGWIQSFLVYALMIYAYVNSRSLAAAIVSDSR